VPHASKPFAVRRFQPAAQGFGSPALWRKLDRSGGICAGAWIGDRKPGASAMTTALFTDVEACVFDAYGTLFDINAPLERRRARIGERADELRDLWRRKQLEYSWLRTIMGKHTDFWRITGDALDFAMDTLDIRDPALRAELMELYLNLDPYPDAKPALVTIKAGGFKTALLSNGAPTMLTAVVNRTHMTASLDAVLSVEERGVFKPHPSVYQLAVEKLGIGSAHICFVSGNAWDLAGAAAFGFQTVWVNRHGASPERLPHGPTATIATLDELPPLLGL